MKATILVFSALSMDVTTGSRSLEIPSETIAMHIVILIQRALNHAVQDHDTLGELLAFALVHDA
jgi:hypothetical protein